MVSSAHDEAALDPHAPRIRHRRHLHLRIDGKEIADLPNAKVLMKRLERGDAITIRAGGGGGFGPPEERDPSAVARDVRQGYVSRSVAEEIYRVALDAEGRVDPEATRRLRSLS